jgi:hypothetical protein
MNKRRRQIECLERYAAYTNGLEDILEFLLAEKMISMQDVKTVKQAPDGAKEVEKLLFELQQLSKIQMLEYEWLLLPVERIKIHIVTDNVNKEFSFNY